MAGFDNTDVIPSSPLLDIVLVLQSGPGPGFDNVPGVDPGVGLGGSAFGAFLSTLLIGGILVALVPGYTERLMDRMRDDAVGSFIYGLLALVALIILMVLLAITIIGIVVVIPLGIIVGLAWAAGASVAFLAIADRLVGREDGWLKPLLVAALINGGLTLTGIGGLVSFAVGAAGFGALLRDWQG
jgi:hypothetical protein